MMVHCAYENHAALQAWPPLLHLLWRRVVGVDVGMDDY